MKPVSRYLLLSLDILNLAACDKLAKYADTRKPTVELSSAKLASIDFKQADFQFDFAVDTKQQVPVIPTLW